jgi:hypothetical protein
VGSEKRIASDQRTRAPARSTHPGEDRENKLRRTSKPPRSDDQWNPSRRQDDSDKKLLRPAKSANVFHQRVDLVLAEASSESGHISSPFSYHASQLGIRLLFDLRRVEIRRM